MFLDCLNDWKNFFEFLHSLLYFACDYLSFLFIFKPTENDDITLTELGDMEEGEEAEDEQHESDEENTVEGEEEAKQGEGDNMDKSAFSENEEEMVEDEESGGSEQDGMIHV